MSSTRAPLVNGSMRDSENQQTVQNGGEELLASPYHSMAQPGETTTTVGPKGRFQRQWLNDFGICFSADTIEFDDHIFHNMSKDDRRSALGKIIRNSTETNSELPHKTAITALYMSIFAMAGCLLRIIMAQLFGEECKNPGTVGWLATGQPFCVTASGVSREGGIVFADLPANMLGSFFMGMMQTGSALDLTTHVPVAFVSVSSAFQHWDVIHLAIRTGFCGSLTTFSSWNSEMIVMIYGTGDQKSRVVRAVFGYIIGLETALGSYVFGKKIAVWLHRFFNPALQEEADTATKMGNQVYINKKLPGFERRYLAGTIDANEVKQHDPAVVEHLNRWKESTIKQRITGHPQVGNLEEIERSILVQEAPPSDALRSVAEQHGWDIDALWGWTKGRNFEFEKPQLGNLPPFRLHVAILIYLLVALPLLLGVVLQNSEDSYAVTYRTMWYSALLAPAGALLRWKLSSFNGTLQAGLTWLPVGTLTANYLGCVVSIIMIASEVWMDGAEQFFQIGTLRAIKIGFAGCLTTVSSFVSEIDTLGKGFPRNNWDWQYVSLSLVGSSVFGVIVYGTVIFLFYGV